MGHFIASSLTIHLAREAHSEHLARAGHWDTKHGKT